MSVLALISCYALWTAAIAGLPFAAFYEGR